MNTVGHRRGPTGPPKALLRGPKWLEMIKKKNDYPPEHDASQGYRPPCICPERSKQILSSCIELTFDQLWYFVLDALLKLAYLRETFRTKA